MYPNLVEHIRKYVSLTEDDIDVLLSHVTSLSLKKKAFLLKEGQICKANYFVEKGCLRMFFISDKDTEQITQFALEGWWLSDQMSLLMQKPAQFNIQAIEATEVMVLNVQSEDELCKALPQLEHYFRLMSQRAYAALQQRMKFLNNLTREQMYHQFNTAFPGFVQRIPQYMLASYLGFTPEYLSEIRKKKQ